MTAPVDVHPAAPADCSRCRPLGQPIPGFACLSHTCPDCGSIVHNEVNAAGELIHRCPS